MSFDKTMFGRLQMQHHALTDLIQWGDHLCVDHPAIDAQHKAIFDLGTAVYEAWRSGAVEALLPGVDKLAGLLRKHFAYEERLLEEIGYAGLAEHAAEHREMLEELETVRQHVHDCLDGQEADAGSLHAPGWPILQFVLAFSIGHVMNGDMDYCTTLAASRNHVQGNA